MKMPGGYGSVYKQKGNRRKPWIVRITLEYTAPEDGKPAKQKRKVLGSYATQKEALAALAEYNRNPNGFQEDISFAELYEKWSEEHYKTLGSSTVKLYSSAYKHCSPLYDMNMRDIRVSDLERILQSPEVPSSMRPKAKVMLKLMYSYALKHELVEKNYAEMADATVHETQIERVPFSNKEIHQLWKLEGKNKTADVVLVALYTGFRPAEVINIKNKNVNFDQMTIQEGIKTKAGKDRLVPIHPKIVEIIKSNMNDGEYLFGFKGSERRRIARYGEDFGKLMKYIGANHYPHDTRHTFATRAKVCGFDEYSLKLIMGHAIDDITEKVYVHRSPEQLMREMEKLNYD